MRIKQLNGLVNDFLELNRDYDNPLRYIFVENKMEINVLTGEAKYPEEDDILNYFKNKSKWIINRIKDLNGNLEDFQEVKIIVFGVKEKISITYKGEKFEKELAHRTDNNELKKFQEELKKTKPFDVRDVIKRNKK